MTRSELRLWSRAYRIADMAMRRPEFRIRREVYHQEGDPLAAHLMAEAIVNLAVGGPAPARGK